MLKSQRQPVTDAATFGKSTRKFTRLLNPEQAWR
nr:MAG TPA: hypothetical protein [Caudoviricetes sp.]